MRGAIKSQRACLHQRHRLPACGPVRRQLVEDRRSDLLLAILDEDGGRPPQHFISVLAPSGAETPLHVSGQWVATAMVWVGEESVLDGPSEAPRFHG